MNNNIYNGPQAPYIPQPVTKVKEKPEYSKAEVVLSVFAFIAAFCAVRYILFNAMGFITTGVFIAIITAAIIYMKKKGCEFSAFNKVLAAVLYVFSCNITCLFLQQIIHPRATISLFRMIPCGSESID